MKDSSWMKWFGGMVVVGGIFLTNPVYAEMSGGDIIAGFTKFTEALNAGQPNDAKKMADLPDVESIKKVFGKITGVGLATAEEIAARGDACGQNGQAKDPKKCFEYGLANKSFVLVSGKNGKSFIFKADFEKGGKGLIGVTFLAVEGDMTEIKIEALVLSVSEKDNAEGFAKIIRDAEGRPVLN